MTRSRAIVAAPAAAAGLAAAAQWAWLSAADRLAGATLADDARLGVTIAAVWGLVGLATSGLAALGTWVPPRLAPAARSVAWAGWLAAVMPVPFAWAGVPNPSATELALADAAGLVVLLLLGRRAPWVAAPFGLVAVLADLPPLPSPPPAAAAAASGPPIVLVTLDTLRADHVRAIAPDGPVPTPNLDALAARGRLFTEGVTPAPLTGPAHAGLLTGARPQPQGVSRNGDALPAAAETVAERLHAAGWRTGAFVSSTVLDRRIGLDQGFERYDDRFGRAQRVAERVPWSTARRLDWLRRPPLQRPGADTVERALAWLAEPSDRPTFLWVHLYDAHAPYTAPPVDDAAMGDRGTPEDIQGWRAWASEHGVHLARFGVTPDPKVREAMRAYAAEVGVVDAAVGELARALPPDARIVVASDHGESLVEHAYVLNHGRHVWQETTRVPLWVVAPRVAPDRVEEPVPSWLVGDTLLALAGLPVPSSLLDARPEGGPAVTYAPGQEARRTITLEKRSAELAYRDGSQVWVVSDQREWRFDLALDPAERDPQPVADEPQADAARRELAAMRSRGSAGDDATSAWLSALGYVE